MRNSLSFAVVCRVITTLSGVATAFISLRLYNLYLTKEIYGTVLVAVQFMSYLPLVSGGFGMVIGQQTLSAQDRTEVAKLARFTQVLQSHIVLIALVAALIIMAIYSQLPNTRTSGLPLPLFFAVGLAGVATFYGGGQIGLMTMLGRQVQSIILTGIWSILGLVLLYVCFRLGFGVWSMPLSTALGPLLLLPVAWTLQRRLVPGNPILSWHRDADFWPKLKLIWRPALDWLQGQAAIMILFTMDIILIGILFGPGPAAVYGVVSRITMMSRQVIQALCDSAWPKLAAQPDLLLKAELMRKVDRLNAWISGAWYGAMLATLQPFLSWLVKPDWVAGIGLITLMLARTLVVSLAAPHAYGLLSAARFRELARLTQYEIIASALGIFAFGHFFGYTGVAMGVLFGTAGGSLWYTTFLYFRTSELTHWFREWTAVYARAAVSCGLGFGVATLIWWAEKSLINAPGWASFVAGGAGLAAGLGAAILYGYSQGGGTSQPLTKWIKLPNRW